MAKKKVKNEVKANEIKKEMKKKNTSKNKEKNVLKKTSLLQEMPGEEKYNGISPINRFNILFADLQFVFTIFTLVCFVWYLFNDKVWDVLQFVLGITMIIIGYNNRIIYNKPKKAYFYYVCGALIIIIEIVSLILGVF